MGFRLEELRLLVLTVYHSYYVCEKSDGMRYLLYLTKGEKNEEVQYLIDRRNQYWFVPPDSLHFPVPRDVEGFHTNSLIDGELVIDRLPNGGVQPKYLVFDCMCLDGNSLMSRTLDKRLAYFKERIYDPYKNLLAQFPQVALILTQYIREQLWLILRKGNSFYAFYYGDETNAIQLRYRIDVWQDPPRATAW